jgi:4-methylaminobutanoate oxidase (formaldehyde-forming)
MATTPHAAPEIAPATSSTLRSTSFWPAFLVLVLFFLVTPVFVYPIFLMKALCFGLFACAFNVLVGYGGLGDFVVGGFEPEPKAWAADGAPWDFTQRLLPPEWGLFEPLLEGAIRRCPALARAEIVQLVNGPDAFTPDGRYALGPVPGVPGFWVAAGMSINGVAGAGGVGRVMAEWIVAGEPPLDVAELDVRRFGSHLADLEGVVERAREVYRHYYALAYPADEPEAGRPARTSALYGRLEALGAVFQERGGWERVAWFAPGQPGRRQGHDERSWARPSYFERVADEHRAVRERAGVLDMSSFGKLDVTGPGALAFLQRLCANDVNRPPGRLVYTQCLNRRGGVECDLTVTRLGPAAFRVTTGTSSAASDLGWLRLHLPDDGSVAIRDVTGELAVVSVWGPAARRALAPLTPADLGSAVFPYLASREIEVAGVPARANRVSFAGELGWELVVAREAAGAVWDAVLERGDPVGLRPVGYQALNTLRLEKGFLYWGEDVGPDDDPFSAGLGPFVRLDKGDFLGRDALLGLRAAGGPATTLRTLVVEADAPVLWGGEPVLTAGRSVARLRSAGYGHTLGAQLGLAYLPAALAAEGTRVEVEAFDQRLAAVVRGSPVWDPGGERLRG